MSGFSFSGRGQNAGSAFVALKDWSRRKGAANRASAIAGRATLLIAFGVLPIRAVLYTLTSNTVALVAIQIFDGIGASLSQTIAGTIVHHFSFDAGFLFLAAIAAAAFSILNFFMPETREKNFLNENL